MPSKPPQGAKRASPPLRSDFTRQFTKDWERLSRSGRFDLGRLKQVMLLLIANDGPMPPEWLDHPLKGKWSDHRECHVGGDFLLIYLVSDDQLIFVRAGTHSELFD